MAGVSRIVGPGSGTQVSFSIVEAIVIDMVNNKAVRDVDDETVHLYSQ